MSDSSLVPSNAASLPWNQPSTPAPVVQAPAVAQVPQVQQPTVAPQVQQPQVAAPVTAQPPVVELPQEIVDELARLRAASSRVAELEAAQAQDKIARQRAESEHQATVELANRNAIANNTVIAAWDAAEARADWEPQQKKAYMATVVRNLFDERDAFHANRLKQLEGELEQQRVQSVMQKYPKHLVEKFGLSPEFEETLASFGDGNLMGVAAQLESRYQSQTKDLRAQVEELTAATMAANLSQGNVFGSGASGAPVSDVLPTTGSARDLRPALSDFLYGR
jgi:hypothetical protein